MMKKMDSITWHIMDAMAEDWESVAQVEPHVLKFCGATPRDRIGKILISLHEDGFLQAMDKNGNGISVLPDDVMETWFRMTPKGRSLWNSEGVKYRDG